MQGVSKTLFVLSLSVLTGAVSLSLITGSVVVMNHLRGHLPITLFTSW